MASKVFELRRGDVVWLELDPTRGAEQAGRRPGLVVASNGYLASVPDLAIVLPVTTVDRHWPHHVPLTGKAVELKDPSWALTEQPRTITRQRIARTAGHVDADCLDKVDEWLTDFMGLY